jgi:hypothetical protein
MVMDFCRALLVLFLFVVSLPLASAGDSFPFGTTLMLDSAPMRGSKRIPMLEIAEDGAVSIDLWWGAGVPRRLLPTIRLGSHRAMCKAPSASRIANRVMRSF